MSTPELLYRNLLQESADHRGDGTIYAWGPSATPSPSAKTISVTITGIIDDLPIDTNDLFNGYEVVFTTSGRSYLIVDWDKGGINDGLATTYETPNAEDTGAWTIRRTLYTDDFNVANPVRFASNGRLYQEWIDSGANSAVSITAALPNFIDDSGFELNSLTDYWTTRGVAGSGTVAINAGSPILGTYDCKLNRGDQTFVGLEQAGNVDLEAGITYGILLKTGGDGGAVTDMRVSLEYAAGATALVPVTFTEINGGDDTGTASIWKPAITDANAWDEVKFTVATSIPSGSWKLVIDQYDATDVFIDQIWIGEPIFPDTFIVGNHNHAGGYPATSYVGGRRCPADLSSVGAGDSDLTFIDLDADVTPTDVIYETFTAPTAIYPFWEIALAALTDKTWEAAEIWLGKRWTWDRFLSGDWEPVDQSIEVVSSVTLGGQKVVSEQYRQRLRGGTISIIDVDEVAEWESFIKEVGGGKPFWYYIQAIPDLGLAGEIMFMRNRSTPKLPMSADRFRSANYDFEEVL